MNDTASPKKSVTRIGTSGEQVMVGQRIKVIEDNMAEFDVSSSMAGSYTHRDVYKRQGYIDEETKDLEKVVGLQTDKPLKRAFMPYGGIKMAEQACETYGYKVSDKIKDVFHNYEFKTHNQGVFDIYTPEMKVCLLYTSGC